MSAKNVDMTVDGYAFLEDVYVSVKDVPMLYLPYVIVPVKTKRQTGFLFPLVGTGSKDGFRYVQPFFVAIDPNQDATLGYGRYSKRGKRGELEYRYRSYEGIRGFVQGFYMEDRDFKLGSDRFGVRSEHDVTFSERFDMKVRVHDTKDRDYARTFPEDIPGEFLPALESNLTGTANLDDVFVSVEAKRYRSIIGTDIGGFNKDMVQVGPSAYFGLRERRVFGLSTNLYATFDRFYREAGPYNDVNKNNIYDPFSVDRIREANRLQLAPEISTAIKLGHYLNLQPSLQFNERLYFFDVNPSAGRVSDFSSRYFLGKMQLSTTIERTFEAAADSKFERFKHQLTPIFTYSNIPWFEETRGHPFSRQALDPGGVFDQFDIIPVRNRLDNLRDPVGNAVSLGFYSRLIRKARAVEKNAWVYPYDFVSPREKTYPNPLNRKQELSIARDKQWDEYAPDYRAYRQVWLVTLNTAYDIREAKRVTLAGDRPKTAWSPTLFRSILSLDNFNQYIEYQYKPYGRFLNTENRYKQQHDLKTNFEWVLQSLINPKGTLFFKRSFFGGYEIVTSPNPSRKFNVGFSWSINDYLAFGYARSFDLINKKRIEESIRSVFNSPSECWQLELNYIQRQIGSDVGVKLGINLMGDGYVGVGGAPGSAPRSPTAGF
jgi:LPS-assembly protein